MITTVNKWVLHLFSVYVIGKKEYICGVLADLLLLFFKISLKPDKLSLPVTVGEYDMACKIAHHVVTARKIIGVTIVIADKNSVFDT